jgi:hypothetical protein
VKFDALLQLHQTGILAQQYGQTRESFENVRQEALQLAKTCGDNWLARYNDRMKLYKQFHALHVW